MLQECRAKSLFFSLAISFLVLVSASTIWAQAECNSLGAPNQNVGSITAGDTAQTSRMFRDGRGTTCLFNRPQTTSAGSYNSDAYTFTNSTGGPICVYVDLDATGCGVATNQLSMAAYLNSYDPANILTNVIADPGLSTGQNFTNSMSFSVANGATYIIVVHNINAGTTCPGYQFRRYITNNCRNAGFDLANDGSADLALFRPSGPSATWQSSTLSGNSSTVQLGSAGDIPVPGDYTGDETTDWALYRGAVGTWYLTTDPATNYGARRWGANSDIPVQGDYDRDGITDLAVFRPSDNNWYILKSNGNVWSQLQLGTTGDKPVPGDYDGDGKMDAAIFHPSNGLWTVLGSSGSYNSISTQLQFGLSTDIPVPADYDGDGKTDVAVYRPSEGVWYIFRSSLTTGQLQTVQFGNSTDIPQPADFDGDRKADQAVFRSSTATWWINRSSSGLIGAQFGQTGDIPVSSPNTIP